MNDVQKIAELLRRCHGMNIPKTVNDVPTLVAVIESHGQRSDDDIMSDWSGKKSLSILDNIQTVRG